MNTHVSSLCLASALVVSSGCRVFKKIDGGLTRFADVLAERQKNHEESRPDSLLQRRGFILYHGALAASPVKFSSVTNVAQHLTFSYTSAEAVSPLYLVLSREFRDILGVAFYEERQRVYPEGFLLQTNKDLSITYSYTFTSEMLRERGRYRYSWWEGIPPEQDPNLIESLVDLFTRDTSQILLEGVCDVK